MATEHTPAQMAMPISAATVCPHPWEPGHGTGCMCGTPLGTRTGAWPAYAEAWFGSTMYPTGRGQEATVSGWRCPGCGACFSPYVQSCWHCPGTTVATGANAPAQPMGEWGDDS